MSSIRSRIVKSCVDRINAAPGKPAEIEARRYSTERIDFQTNSSRKVIEVHPSKDVPQPLKSKAQSALIRTLTVRFDIYSAGEPIDEEMDVAQCLITSVITSDISVEGLAVDVREGPAEWDEEMALNGLGLCKVSFEIDYIHNRNNQETKP